MSEMRKGFGVRFAIVLAAAAVMLFTLIGTAYLGGGLHFGAGDYHIDAVLPTASTLIPGARVTMAGAQVGQVASVSRRGNGALVQLDITDRDVTPIPADSRVELREVTAIGENYVRLLPGTSRRKLASGTVLPMTQSDPYVDVDQLLSVLQGSTTHRAQQLIDGLGAALDDRGPQLNGTLAGVSRTFHPLANIVALLNNDRSATEQLVLELGDVAAAAGERGQSIIELANGGLRTFRALGAQDASLRDTFDQLPSTLTQIRTTADTLNDVTNTAAPVVSNLAGALTDLKPAVTSLKPAADEGRAVLNELHAAAPGLQTTLGDLRGLASPTKKALPQLQGVLCQVNPMLRYIDPNPTSSAPNYVGDLISFIGSFGSAVNSYDNISHLVSIVPIFGDNSVAGLPPAVSSAAHDLIHAGILANSTALTWNPYPKPGQIGTEHADAGNAAIIGPAQTKLSGYVYPHITADC